MRQLILATALFASSAFATPGIEIAPHRYEQNQADWLAGVAEFHNATHDRQGRELHTVVTPAEDMAKVAELLETDFNTPFVVKSIKAECPSCERRINFLDIVLTALESVHTPAFLRDVFAGKHGSHVMSDAPHQRVVCSECGTTQPQEVVKFNAPIIPEDALGKIEIPEYPVYSYRYDIPPKGKLVEPVNGKYFYYHSKP